METEVKIKTFSSWSIEDAVKTFGFEMYYEGEGMEDLLYITEMPNEEQKKHLNWLRKRYIRKLGTWNEFELEASFLVPVLDMAEFYDAKVDSYMERTISAEIEGWRLYGDIDWMIAQGFGRPEATFFCLDEFKKSKSKSGDPEGQLITAMLVAQELNRTYTPDNQLPVYGAYILGGSAWRFCMLKERVFSQSLPFDLTDEEKLFKMFGVLKNLKRMIFAEMLRRMGK